MAQGGNVSLIISNNQMDHLNHSFAYLRFPSLDELPEADKRLLIEAQLVAKQAYAPYSNFKVGAAAMMVNDQLVKGTNQENASYPAGICAERVLLSTASSIYPGVALKSMAISYESNTGNHHHPISPCGICRQSLVEFQIRFNQSIKLILGGQTGEIWVFEHVGLLLPFGFEPAHLK